MRTFSLNSGPFFKKVDLLFERAVGSHLPHPPGYGPDISHLILGRGLLLPGKFTLVFVAVDWRVIALTGYIGRCVGSYRWFWCSDLG